MASPHPGEKTASYREESKIITEAELGFQGCLLKGVAKGEDELLKGIAHVLF